MNDIKNELFAERANMLQLLKQTDYIALKLAEGAATVEDYAQEIEMRKNCRKRINEIDEELE